MNDAELKPSSKDSLLFSHLEKKPVWKPRVKGRPKLQLDERFIFALAKQQNTVAAIARMMECDDQTLTANYMDVIERGWEEGRIELRQLQWKSAENGSTRMQEWLGINYLGQKSRIDEEAQPTTFNVNVLAVPSKEEATKIIDAKTSAVPQAAKKRGRPKKNVDSPQSGTSKAK